MMELKAYLRSHSGGFTEFYLKSEADNVIAELESRVKRLESEIENIAVDNVDAHMEIIRMKEESRRIKETE